jgi:GNAT superfamily N-acetyltransferase
MNENGLITPLNNGHCEGIINLILPIQQIEFNVPITLDGQPDLLDIEANYHKTGGCFWGAMYNGQLVGTIGLISGVIRKMFVHKDFRGKEHGVAQRLLNTLVDYSKGIHITDIYLSTVDILKAAHRFYEKNGFARLEKADMPAYFPFMAADNVYYHLHLNDKQQHA